MVACRSAVMRMLGRLACRCSAPGPSRGLGLYPVHTPRDQGDDSAHPQTPEPRVPPTLLAGEEEWSHEGFTAGGA